MATAAPGATGGNIDFGRSFTFVGEDPDWIKKILIGGAFTLACAVLVGVPFVLGYFSRTLRNVAGGAATPLPEWDDLGGLFEEGLRPTAVYLLHVLALMVVLAVFGGALLLPFFVLSGGKNPAGAIEPLAALAILALYAVVMLLSFALAAYLPAALMRAALRGSVGDGFAWRENLGFIRDNLANYVLALVSYLLASFLAQFGLLLCCVGVFPAMFWSYLVLAFALGQTFRLGGAS